MRVLLRFPVARLGCRLVRGEVPDAALEVGPVSTWMEVHLASCLACQADVGSCDAAGEAIGELAALPPHRAPVGLAERVLADLDRSTPTERRRRRAAIGWSAGAASAAAATAAVVLARRSRVLGAQ
jgi:hypothetical protein